MIINDIGIVVVYLVYGANINHIVKFKGCKTKTSTYAMHFR